MMIKHQHQHVIEELNSATMISFPFTFYCLPTLLPKLDWHNDHHLVRNLVAIIHFDIFSNKCAV